MSKLVAAVKLDRDIYFPGELGEITIAIQNPTSKSLKIWKPFVNETGMVAFLEKGGVLARAYGMEYGSVSPGPDVVDVGTKPRPLPTEKLKPGEQMVRTFHFYDRVLGNCRGYTCCSTAAHHAGQAISGLHTSGSQ
jgi:hypothetical protein